MIKEYRHFDQVKRVEKSPKAKQYCTTILLSPCPLQRLFSLLPLIFPYFTQSTKQFGNPTLCFFPTSQLSLLIAFILFLLFIVVIICYTCKFLLFYFYQFSTSVRGSLDSARDDGTRSDIFTRKDDLSRRFFGFFKPSE